jgi:hypothetical protein
MSLRAKRGNLVAIQVGYASVRLPRFARNDMVLFL